MTSEFSAPLRHVVHIRLEPDIDESVRVPLERDLRELVEQHPYAKSASLHRDLGRRPAAPVSATWMVTMDFPSMADFELYLRDPLHANFLQTHQESMTFITAIQFALEDREG
jgi:hypothetical protein